MGHFIEPLESRRLLSAAPSVAALAAEGNALTAQVKSLKQLGKTDFNHIAADLKAAGELKSSKGLLKILSVEGAAGQNVLNRGESATISLITKDVKKLEAAAKKLSKKPSNLTLAAKVMAADNTLQTDAANRLTIITNDLTAQHDANSANVKAIEDANPTNTQLASDLSNTIGPGLDAARTAVGDDATLALTTDVNAVIAAFPA